MRYVSHLKNSCGALIKMACFPIVLTVVISCGNNTTKVEENTESQEDISYHADNDIAMTVRSLVDAVRVGEVLDTAVYNFSGILTDGQGTPLYTDVEGSPGSWSVKVIGDQEAVIRNLYVGDLMAEDLRNYVIDSLNLNSADLVTAYENPEHEGEIIYLYDTGDVNISFSITPAQSKSGLEGWLMAVTVRGRAA